MATLSNSSRGKAFTYFLLFVSLLAPVIGSAAERTDKDKRVYRSEMQQADQKIYDEVQAHSELMKNLEYLTTSIGPRLTGSPQMQRASDWTLQRFKDYGIDAHLETLEIAHGWTRGADTAEIVAPIQRVVQIRSLGWSKATPGPATATVVPIDAKSVEDLAKYKGQLKGAIVVMRSAEMSDSNEVPENAYDAVVRQKRGAPSEVAISQYRQRRELMKALAAEQPAAILLDSGKTDNLFNMTSLGQYQPSEAPVAFLSHEESLLVRRLAATGPVKMNLNLAGTFSPGPVPASITVAEIKGTELPDEHVIIGGHLDSWDLGQGALDNGAGAMAVLEAARTLKSLGWKPKRTLTFILFTGEEQGSNGAKLYLQDHAAEIPKMDGLLVLDTGTGKVFSIALEDLYETAPLMTEIYRPLQDVFDMQPLSTRNFGASDHEPFLDKGVPAYFCVQTPAHYGEAHHSQTDTFDKVIPGEINEGAALLAAWAWNVSEMPVALPHHSAKP
jgi:carboxypeptidase Q